MPGHSLKKQGVGWIYVHDADFAQILACLPGLSTAISVRGHGRPRPWTNPAQGNDVDLKTMAAHQANMLDALQRWETPHTAPYRARSRDDHSLILELLRQLVSELKKKKNADGSHTPKNLWRSGAGAPPADPPDNGATPPVYRQPQYDNFVEAYVLEFQTELAQKPSIIPYPGPPPAGATQLARVAQLISIMTGMLP